MMRLPVSWLLLSLICAAFSGCSSSERTEGGGAAPVRLTGVPVVSVAEQTVPEMLEVIGTVRARTTAVVAARIPGTVSLLKVREGDRVRKGQFLGQLESHENAATAAAADAAIEEAMRAVEEAKARKSLAEATFERFQRLHAEQAVTRQEFDVRQTEREVAIHALARAEARLRQARESARGATSVADYRRIIAPLSGIVTVKHVDLGATVFPAQPLMTVEDDTSYRLELAVPESVSGRIRRGMTLPITVEGSKVTTGKVVEVVPRTDPASRTFLVKADIPPDGIRSGMFGRAQVAVGAAKGILVPRESVREQGSLLSVWVVDRDGRARMRLVKLGKLVGENIEVLSGLSPGERVVAAGVGRVTEGALLQ